MRKLAKRNLAKRNLPFPFIAALAAFLGHFCALRFVPHPTPPPDPTYVPPLPTICPPPPALRHRPSLPPCGQLRHLTSTSVVFSLPLAAPATLTLTNPHCPPDLLSRALNGSATVTLANLPPDTDLVLSLSSGCRSKVSTPPVANLLRNPSFETVADPPFVASAFRTRNDLAPRHWTPFYNGRARRVCGVTAEPSEPDRFVMPRSGNCMLRLGGAAPLPDEARVFHGTHQAVIIAADAVVVKAWYRTAGLKWQTDPESPADWLAMVVSWRGAGVDDGVRVQFGETDEWTQVCVHVQGPVRAVHVFFHLHDAAAGSLFVDDVSVQAGVSGKGCYSAHVQQGPVVADAVRAQLAAELRPKAAELTVAVPLTAERVLRLEALSRHYGGAIVAAVAVRTAAEAARFAAVWRAKAHLRRHVDVAFVRRGGGALPINALRNAAVRLAATEFVAMLDVDMTPTAGWECLQTGQWLAELLPRGARRVLSAPVLVADVHVRPPGSKAEACALLGHRAGTVYCANSQRAHRMRRWYGEGEAVETRFVTDFEPYAVARREGYVGFDERFGGYGFNKVAWGVAVAKWGRVYVLPGTVVTHLNHVENEWVSGIDVGGYLGTWRRFLAFVVEIEGGVDDGELELDQGG